LTEFKEQGFAIKWLLSEARKNNLIMYEDERKAKAMTGKEVLSKQ
jgi:hypothetical protein